MVEKEKEKEKDIGQIVRYLTSTFNQITARMERPFRGKTSGPNQTYLLQTDFAYLLNEVMQSPRCMLQKRIIECNEFLDQLSAELKELEASTKSE